MKDFIFQTVAKLFRYLCLVSEEAILHILSDVKMTYSTLTDSHWNGERSGRNMRRHNEKWKNLCPTNPMI